MNTTATAAFGTMEKRQSPRFNCFEEVALTVDSRTYSGIMLNVSETGFFILTNLKFDPGRRVQVSYFSKSRMNTIEFDGTVVRRESNGIGIRL